jgi:predicted ATP-grasp superfamily ATP-dependent carboligase
VIVGGHFLSLGAARNLAELGVPVLIVDDGPCVSQFSRSVRGFFKCPPVKDESGCTEFLLQIGQENGLEGWVLFPSTDESVKLLARNWEALSQSYAVTTPPWSVTQHFYDKRLTHKLATNQGIPIPGTWTTESEADLESLDVEFPVVLKPAITTHLTTVTKKKAYRADDRQALLATYRMMAAFLDPSEILIQELVPGRAEALYSFCGLFQEGELVTGFSARRPRQHPMEFGRASTLAETVVVPELEVLAQRLMEGIGYSGLAEVEFMYDSKHTRFEFLEVNARIWGWHTIARRAGVNLPYLAHCQALGQPVASGPYREGVKWIRLLTDVPTVAVELWHRRMTVGQYLRSLRGHKEFAVFSLTDPLPFFAEILLIPYYARQRGF